MIPGDELKGVVEALLEYPDASIDEFFFNCGLSYEDARRRVGNRALTPGLLAKIRIDKEESEAFETLSSERSKEEIFRSLEKTIGFKRQAHDKAP